VKRLIVAACLGAFAAPALAKDSQAEASWEVIDPRAAIHSPSMRVSAVRPGTDNTAIIEVLGGRTYRAHLFPGCRDAAFGAWLTIGMDTRGDDRFERGSFLTIDGRRCRVSAVEELQDPERAADAQGEPAEGAETD
jgi:hypothetical protein